MRFIMPPSPKKPWTSQEISSLKRHYLLASPLEEMAHLLGRSKTSVNKALTRFNIRLYKPPLIPKPKVETSPMNWLRKIECNMEDVFDFVEKCMKSRLKHINGKWIYHGSEINKKRAMVLINIERTSRKFPPFYFEYDSV